jgi:hypothetical protein
LETISPAKDLEPVAVDLHAPTVAPTSPDGQGRTSRFSAVGTIGPALGAPIRGLLKVMSESMTEERDLPAPPEGGSPESAGHRTRRWVVLVGLAVAAVLVAATAVVLVAFLVREDPQQKDVGEAVEEFREDAGPQPGGANRPPAGVYLAEGTGRESLSFPPISQNDGDEVPVTVEHEGADCWILTIDFNEAHWQNFRYCPGSDSGTLVETGGDTFQRWDLGSATIENLSTFTCDPPSVMIDSDAKEGDAWDHSCEGTNSQVAGVTTTAGPYTYVGLEQIDVDGKEVATRHYRQERAISGAQRGSTTIDLWFAVDDNLPLRSERSIQLDSDSPVGTITYTETGSWQLESLEPRT